MCNFDCQVATCKTALIGGEDDKEHYATEHPQLIPVCRPAILAERARIAQQMKPDVLQRSDGKNNESHELHKPVF